MQVLQASQSLVVQQYWALQQQMRQDYLPLLEDVRDLLEKGRLAAAHEQVTLSRFVHHLWWHA